MNDARRRKCEMCRSSRPEPSTLNGTKDSQRAKRGSSHGTSDEGEDGHERGDEEESELKVRKMLNFLETEDDNFARVETARCKIDTEVVALDAVVDGDEIILIIATQRFVEVRGVSAQGSEARTMQEKTVSPKQVTNSERSRVLPRSSLEMTGSLP